MRSLAWSIGSRWMRWDPHLHAPGTLRNDQFAGDWDGYIRALEEATPPPVALGITDYFTLRSYKEFVRRRQSGSMIGILLVFPNIELRLTIETRERKGINLHLLVCPDDPDHVARMDEKLASLTFRYDGEPIPCTEEGLCRLGRLHRRNASLEREAALAEGVNQFKVEFNDLRKMREEDRWVKENVLFAIAAGNDGLAGISQDASFAAQRQELGRFADVVFSGAPSDRRYWLGDHPGFHLDGQTAKPCLHGSDAHSTAQVLAPTQSRHCWIRAEPTFDGLRQTLVEPERRVFIGPAAPVGPEARHVIRSVRFRDASWLATADLELNPGLVTIIGAKGSGKTALADLIAIAADAGEDEPGPASFVRKAGRLLEGLSVELEWADGTKQDTTFPYISSGVGEPRVRYLSQQFVERLSSPEGLTEPLVDEIESVVFGATPEEDRLECSTFSDLRALTLEALGPRRGSAQAAIARATRLVAQNQSLVTALPSQRSKRADAQRQKESIEKAIKELPVAAEATVVSEHQGVVGRLALLRSQIAAEERHVLRAKDLRAEIGRQIEEAARAVTQLQEVYGDLLTPEEWEKLRFRPDPGAADILARREAVAVARVERLRAGGQDLKTEVTAGGINPSQGLAALVDEERRLTDLLGTDRVNAKRRMDLATKLQAARKLEEDETKRLAVADGAPARIKTAVEDRYVAYGALFDALVEERGALERLYVPLRESLNESMKLSFKVDRAVDLEGWAARGENLLDLRKSPFGGRGALLATAKENLLEAWRNGSSREAVGAVREFVDTHGAGAAKALVAGVSPADFGAWLFSTDHITVRYGVEFEGVSLANLSPGARGVVLLTLYLALDKWDDRPLLIDQPEENLDPRSVQSDLVPFFRKAAERRQIIMVTHNANLVVNTDSDQVIVSASERTSPTELPTIKYAAGALEASDIREAICDLLEGGREAFQKRGRRYGMRP